MTICGLFPKPPGVEEQRGRFQRGRHAAAVLCVRLSVRLVTMTFMSELPAGDTHDVIHQAGRW